MKKLNLLTFAILFWVVALILQFVVGIEIEMATVRKIATIAMIPVIALIVLMLSFYLDAAAFFFKKYW